MEYRATIYALLHIPALIVTLVAIPFMKASLDHLTLPPASLSGPSVFASNRQIVILFTNCRNHKCSRSTGVPPTSQPASQTRRERHERIG